MDNEIVTIIGNLLVATIAGGMIGLERSYRKASNLLLLSQTLSTLDSLVDFEIAPTGD